jgi:hypothetical protein
VITRLVYWQVSASRAVVRPVHLSHVVLDHKDAADHFDVNGHRPAVVGRCRSGYSASGRFISQSAMLTLSMGAWMVAVSSEWTRTMSVRTSVLVILSLHPVDSVAGVVFWQRAFAHVVELADQGSHPLGDWIVVDSHTGDSTLDAHVTDRKLVKVRTFEAR